MYWKRSLCQPPCEAVSWNESRRAGAVHYDVSLLVRLWVEMWGICYRRQWVSCQPPCEAVSWNVHIPKQRVCWDTSASLWGCELKYKVYIKAEGEPKSASLWGCELKFVRVGVVEWRNVVSLLVRLWVEMRKTNQQWGNHVSASLWGCELKYISGDSLYSGFVSASLWGCELKCMTLDRKSTRKEVSLLVRLWVEIRWAGIPETSDVCQPPCEAVSWNSNSENLSCNMFIVSLLVRLWVEMSYTILL